MPINQKNNPDAIDANPAIDNAGLSTSPSVGGANPLGSAYSPTAGADLYTSTGSASSSDNAGNKINMQMVTDFYNRASQWIKQNPALAISAAAGIVAAVTGIIATSQASKRRSGNFQNRYPTGQTYGNVYGSGSVSYNPLTQTESIDTAGNYTSSGSDTYTGYDSAKGNMAR